MDVHIYTGLGEIVSVRVFVVFWCPFDVPPGHRRFYIKTRFRVFTPRSFKFSGQAVSMHIQDDTKGLQMPLHKKSNFAYK